MTRLHYLLDFHRYININILFAAHLKHSSFKPSSDVKQIANDPVHAMAWLCMFALSLSLSVSTCVCTISFTITLPL
jgi:hypothetical protein